MMTPTMTFNLLTVMGKVTTDSVEATRQLHNQSAGNPEGVAAAKHLGDMSHMTYMPLDAATNFSGDLLFLDIWNNIEGMQQFFSDPQVQAGGNMLFSTREAIVWRKLEGFLHYEFPTPFGQNDRIVGIVQGKVHSLEAAQEIHNKAIGSIVNLSRANGMVSHHFYVRMAAPGSPEALEVLGVDVWMSAEGMGRHYSSPEFQGAGMYPMFAEKPKQSTWVHPQGEWIEW
jgi:hypothetical protein